MRPLFLLFVGFLGVLPVQGRAEILFSVENPAQGVAAAGISVMSLWAFSTMPGATMDAKVSIDTTDPLALSCGTDRLDVQIAYKDYPNARKSGCGMLINFGNLQPGVHSFRWILTSSVGEIVTSHQLVTTVRYGDAEFVDQFDLSGISLKLDKDTQEIILENVKVRNAATGKWQTTTLRFHFVVGTQGLQLSSALTVSGDQAIAFVVSPTGDFQTVSDMMHEVVDYFQGKMQREPNKFTVFSFRDIEKLVDAYMEWRKLPAGERKSIKNRWTWEVAEAGFDFLFVNTGNDFWLNRATPIDKDGVVTHEAIHVLQHQLVGWPGLNREPDNQVPYGGPRWLIEGVAIYLAEERMALEGGWSLKDVRTDRIARAKQCQCALQSLETWTGMSSAGLEAAYATSFLAVDFSGLSFRELMNFWVLLGARGKWEEVFPRVFGKDKNAFYQAFEVYRKNL